MMMQKILDKLAGRPSCGEVLELLQSYLDGEIDEKTARKVAEHLDRCDHCESEAHVYEQIKASLAAREIPVDPVVRTKLEAYGRGIMTGQVDS